MSFEGANIDMELLGKSYDAELLGKVEYAISSNQETSRYLKYGVKRRFLDIGSAVRMLQSKVPPGRVYRYEDDYDIDEYALISLLLNSIYMNIAGLLDNTAWFLVEYRAIKLSNNLDVGLFNKRYWQQIGLEDLKKEIFVYKDWYKEFRSIRDPIVHRIPLYIPMIAGNINASTGHPRVAQYFKEYETWELYKKLRDDLSNANKILKTTLDYLYNA